jgi:hypothetical protein
LRCVRLEEEDSRINALEQNVAERRARLVLQAERLHD